MRSQTSLQVNRSGSGGLRLLPILNLLMLLGVVVVIGTIQRRVDQERALKDRLSMELGETKQNICELEAVSARRLKDLRIEASAMREAADDDVADYSSQVDTVLARLENLEAGSAKDNARTFSTLREELAVLRTSFKTELASRIPEHRDQQEVFRSFERRHGRGIVIIYTEFDYERLINGRVLDTKTVTGWGTGFFADAEGHIVTNKHVVSPWKFDSDLAAMEALGEIRVLHDTIRIGCWPAGERVLLEDGEPCWSTGFNNHRSGNLRVYALADDAMNKHTLEIGGTGTDYETHGLNNNDLAILQANGPGISPVPLNRHANSRPLSKLDPIMVVGFPRGRNGLERGAAESSASIGCVRKVEDTIHVTASIIPGNSGGPLVGPDGKVVGIVTRIYSETLGICIKLQHALDLIERGRQAEATAIAANIK